MNIPYIDGVRLDIAEAIMQKQRALTEILTPYGFVESHNIRSHGWKHLRTGARIVINPEWTHWSYYKSCYLYGSLHYNGSLHYTNKNEKDFQGILKLLEITSDQVAYEAHLKEQEKEEDIVVQPKKLYLTYRIPEEYRELILKKEKAVTEALAPYGYHPQHISEDNFIWVNVMTNRRLFIDAAWTTWNHYSVQKGDTIIKGGALNVVAPNLNDLTDLFSLLDNKEVIAQSNPTTVPTTEVPPDPTPAPKLDEAIRALENESYKKVESQLWKDLLQYKILLKVRFLLEELSHLPRCEEVSCSCGKQEGILRVEKMLGIYEDKFLNTYMDMHTPRQESGKKEVKEEKSDNAKI